MTDTGGAASPPTGDALVRILGALGSPHRLRIVAALAQGRNYVSRLAREIGMSRPLLHMHLQRLEAAGLVVGSLELSDGGKAVKYFELAPFDYRLSPAVIRTAVETLTEPDAPTTSSGPSNPPSAGRGARKGPGSNPDGDPAARPDGGPRERPRERLRKEEVT